MAQNLAFGKILNHQAAGSFKLSPTGVVWRSPESKIELAKGDIAAVRWRDLGGASQLQVTTEERSESFSGFKTYDFDTIGTFFKEHFGVDIKKEELASKGRNWGSGDFEDGSNFIFRDDKEKIMFELQYSGISQCAALGRNDVELQFDDDVVAEGEQLINVRFHVPGEGNDKVFHGAISEKAGVVDDTADPITVIKKCQFLTPRGTYDIHMFTDHLRLIGMSYDFSVKYRHINCLYLLPRPDKPFTAILLNLSRPLLKGRQRYPNLVMHIPQQEEDIEVNLPSPEDYKTKYNGRLAPTMTNMFPKLLASLFKHICGKKVYIPSSFKSNKRESAVRATVSANTGHLYPLESCLVFIHNPAVVLPHDDIDYVEFLRVTGGAMASRTFDLKVVCKRIGDEAPQTITFNGMEREEFDSLFKYTNARRLRLVGYKPASKKRSVAYADLAATSSESEDDEDFKAGDAPVSSSEDDSGFESEGELKTTTKKRKAPTAKPTKKKKAAPKKKPGISDEESSDEGDDDEEEAKEPVEKKARTE